MYRPMDTEAQALIGTTNHYLSHDYSSAESKDNARINILAEWDRLNTIPIGEFSQSTWDELNILISKVTLTEHLVE